MKTFVSTHPFGATSAIPFELAKNEKLTLTLNEYGRKMSSDELAEALKRIGGAEVLIAGTEKITAKVLDSSPALRLIARVGIGLDGIDFLECSRRGIRVTYTPDAPSWAVAELTVGLIISSLRNIYQASFGLKNQATWDRQMGGLIRGRTIGLIGLGRIGKTVAHLLSHFNPKIIACDINPDFAFAKMYNIQFVSKQEILRYSDIVSLHLPLKEDTKNYLSEAELCLMKEDAHLVNTSRGGIVNENALAQMLIENKIRSAAVDVFESEPYLGDLQGIENALLTCHMGACTVESRTQMEIEAVEEVIRFSKGFDLKNEVFGNE